MVPPVKVVIGGTRVRMSPWAMTDRLLPEVSEVTVPQSALTGQKAGLM